MASTIVGVFNGPTEAQEAVLALERAGIGASQVSVIGRSGIARLTGAAVGIPGVGPAVAAGPIVAALGASGLLGALAETGVPEEESHYYAEGVRRGDVLVMVQAPDPEAQPIRDIFNRRGAVDIERRVSSWRQRGWVGHHPGLEPLSEDEIRREHEFYGKAEDLDSEWKQMTAKERQRASDEPEGTRWPHREAYDIGEALVEAATDDTGARIYEVKR